MPDPATEDLKKMLSEIVPNDPQVRHEHRLITGDPATAIARVAEEEGAELIVMGTHGRTGLLRLLMGSVAEAVVRRAPCPVLTLKQPHDQEQQDSSVQETA
jgi:universal stress protein A